MKIPLQVHHISGDRYDNRIENLQLLCPNCHALTDNYMGKNRKIYQNRPKCDEIYDVLKTNDDNRAQSAIALDVTRQTFKRWLKECQKQNESKTIE